MYINYIVRERQNAESSFITSRSRYSKYLSGSPTSKLEYLMEKETDFYLPGSLNLVYYSIMFFVVLAAASSSVERKLSAPESVFFSLVL